MSRLILAVLSPKDVAARREEMFAQIAASYEVFTPQQRHDLLEDAAFLDRLAIEERTALRDLMTYVQARFWRLNFLTPDEIAGGEWMTVEEAWRACRVFGIAKEDKALIGEAIEMNLLPIHDSSTGTLIGVADFAAWHEEMTSRMRERRPETSDYGHIVFQQAV